jgi:hypothetical protein
MACPRICACEALVTSLSAQGQTVQLAVTAAYADGTKVGVTQATSGTDYRTSNAAIQGSGLAVGFFVLPGGAGQQEH